MFEEEEEYTDGYGPPSKAYRILRGCFKGVLYGASALVWILIFYTLFSTRESKLLKRMYFTDATHSVAAETEDYRVYQLYTGGFMNRDGSIELRNLWYAPETGELEIGVKYNKKLIDTSLDNPVRYVLTDQDGKEYPLVRLEQDAIGRYGYARVCFSGLSIPVKEEDDWKLTLTLSLYHPDTDRPLSTYISDDRLQEINNATFTVYDDSTLTGTVKYDD